jgi:transposase-like protein
MLGLLPGPEEADSGADRVPPPVQVALPDGTVRTIDVNFCKRPVCANFGVPATGKKYGRRAKQPAGPPAGHDYVLSGSTDRTPVLKCRLCGEFPPIKSNRGVGEEFVRLARYLDVPTAASCKTPGCANADVSVSDPNAYQRFGKSARGSQRFRCRTCGKTLSVPASPVLRQRLPHKNRTIFKLLLNKAPLSRICEVAEVSMQTVYDKLDFLHQQCLTFAAKQERALLSGFKRERLYVAVDRQTYVVNWSERKDKRNVTLNALGSADLDTGYVFGMHLNYDSEVSSARVSQEAADIGDFETSPPFRRYARLWLEPDYAKATAASARRLARKASGDLAADIEAGYQDAESREDIESQDLITAGVQFPKSGMQVRSEYTLYGHFFFLRELFRGVDKVRFYLDQESGIRAACLAAFEHEIRARTCDAFYVRLEKELTDGEKKKLIAESRQAFGQALGAHPGLSPSEVKVLMMRQEIARAAVHGKWNDRWLLHPFPNNSEPRKALCYLTDFEDYDEEHLANLYLKGSLHSIDRFFMQVRRRLSFLERPIATASKTYRTWYGYSAYRPQNIEKLLSILRVYYNYCLAGEDGKTPAMRLGLATHVVQFDELMGVK